jgi:hypothetical protein
MFSTGQIIYHLMERTFLTTVVCQVPGLQWLFFSRHTFFIIQVIHTHYKFSKTNKNYYHQKPSHSTGINLHEKIFEKKGERRPQKQSELGWGQQHGGQRLLGIQLLSNKVRFTALQWLLINSNSCNNSNKSWHLDSKSFSIWNHT